MAAPCFSIVTRWQTRQRRHHESCSDCEPIRYRSHNAIKLLQLLFGCLTRIYVMDYISLLALQTWRLSSGGEDQQLRLSECAWWDRFLMLCLFLLLLSKLTPRFSCDWYMKCGKKSNTLWKNLSNQKAIHCGNAYYSESIALWEDWIDRKAVYCGKFGAIRNNKFLDN